MMKVMSYVWLAATLLACGWDSRAGTVVTNKLTIANGEHWWGGAAGFGTKMPFDGSSAVRIDLTVDNWLSRAEEALAYALNALKYPYSEYRNGWHLGGQPIVQRLIDKPHTWDAVRQLVPDMMAAGLLGYQFVCPDMAGGGSWTAFLPGARIDQEIFVRSVQVHALCGQMQFSASPWRLLDAEHQEAVRKAANLRQSFVPYILDLARTCAKSGEPMIRNLEYAYPHQGYAEVRDQFLLGEKLLVAPQVNPGAKVRKVEIPRGRWEGDDGKIVVGPCSIAVTTSLERIPHYVWCAGEDGIVK